MQREQPESVAELRRGLVSLAVGTEVRHVLRWKRSPWPFLGTADKDRPHSDLLGISKQIFNGCEKCHDPDHGQKIWRELRKPEDLLRDDLQELHYEIADNLDMQNDDCERGHGDHKRTFGRSTAPAAFCCRSFLRQCQTLSKDHSCEENKKQKSKKQKKQSQRTMSRKSRRDCTR